MVKTWPPNIQYLDWEGTGNYQMEQIKYSFSHQKRIWLNNRWSLAWAKLVRWGDLNTYTRIKSNMYLSLPFSSFLSAFLLLFYLLHLFLLFIIFPLVSTAELYLFIQFSTTTFRSIVIFLYYFFLALLSALNTSFQNISSWFVYFFSCFILSFFFCWKIIKE